MNFLVSNAVASSIEPSQDTSYFLIVILIVFSLIFYNIILRPQHKATKIRKELIDSIAKGDEVLTSCGLIGRVVKVVDIGYLHIALNDSNEVIINRNFITAVLPKGTIKAL